MNKEKVLGGYKGVLSRVLARKTHQELADMDFRALVEETLGIYCDPEGGFDGRKYARKLRENSCSASLSDAGPCCWRYHLPFGLLLVIRMIWLARPST